MYLAEGESAEETYQATITSLENAVSDLEEELADAEDEVEEYQYYVDCGYSYDDELEAAQLEYSTIEANLQIAKNNLTTQSIEAKQTYDNAMTNYKYADQLYAIDTDGLEDDLNDAQDTLDEANDALEEFESQIGDGIIYAEYTGTIQSVSYSAGDDITSDAAVATFSDADAVTITVSVAQDDISSITIGDEVSIELTAYDGESFDGEVTSIETASSMGSSTVNYNVEVRFTGDTSKVYSGMTGEVVFVEKKVEDTLYVSNKAVFQDGANSCVKVKRDDGTIETVTVKTGFSNGSVVAIEDGLEEGDIVLIESRVTS
jgi:HlyD family secretion protein